MNIRYLVTAANGHTGYTTAVELLERGLQVRALVRNLNSEKVKKLEAMGAEIFKGNLDDYRDIESALVGINRVYFCPPFERNTLLKSVNFIVAAEAAGIEHVVYMSQWIASPAHPAINTREQWLAGKLAQLHRNTTFTLINTGLFGFTYFFTIEMVTQLGIYPTLIAKEDLAQKALNAPPSEEDQGRVIAAILAKPAGHVGKTYRITGPKLISHLDVINSYSNALGRKIKPRTIDKNMLFKSLKAMGGDTYQLTNITHYMDELANGAFSSEEGVNELVYELTGRHAESIDDMVKREIKRSGLGKRSFKRVSKAIMFFFKTLVNRAPNLTNYEKHQHFPVFNTPPILAWQNPLWKKEHLKASPDKAAPNQTQARPGSQAPYNNLISH